MIGFKEMNQKLAKLRKEAGNPNVSVQVGYSQHYAVVVHEDLNMQHKPGKTAKYLENPAREKAGEIAKTAVMAYKKTKNLALALTAAGLHLLRLSKKVVPVDTGALKASGYVSVGDDNTMITGGLGSP